MLEARAFAGDERKAETIAPDQVLQALESSHQLLWLDVTNPSDEEIDWLGKTFDFHPLSLRDLRAHHPRPKLVQYDNYLFLVFYVMPVAGEQETGAPQEVTFFVGEHYLICVHTDDIPQLKGAVSDWQQSGMQEKSGRAAILLYELLDTIVDGYFPVLDAIAERVDDLEDAIFGGYQESALQEIVETRKHLLKIRRVIAPERDLTAMLMRIDNDIIGRGSSILFQNLYDHVMRVSDAIDTYRDLLSGSLDAYLSVVSNRLNQIMRTLTSWSIILMVLALIAGIYGENFALAPTQDTPWGFTFTLILMAALSGGLFYLFKRIRWL